MTKWENDIYGQLTHEYLTLTKPQAMTVIMIMQQETKRFASEIRYKCDSTDWGNNIKKLLKERGIK